MSKRIFFISQCEYQSTFLLTCVSLERLSTNMNLEHVRFFPEGSPFHPEIFQRLKKESRTDSRHQIIGDHDVEDQRTVSDNKDRSAGTILFAVRSNLLNYFVHVIAAPWTRLNMISDIVEYSDLQVMHGKQFLPSVYLPFIFCFRCEK